MLAVRLAEAGQLPDWVLRAGIRALLRRRLERSVPDGVEERADAARRFIRRMDADPPGPVPAVAPGPHGHAPARFFELVLGRHLHCGSGLFEGGASDLDAAEAAMLSLACTRAEIDDGMRILDLGCGWGALSLWMAQHYPASRVVAVSGAPAQKSFIEARARERGIGNLQVVGANGDGLDAAARFDRVVSLQGFERARNWRALMSAIAHRLDSGGKLFAQVCCHRDVPYAFDDGAPDGWIARHFLAGAMMPSAELALHFQDDLRIERVYRVGGLQFRRTCREWLANLDRRSGDLLDVLAGAGGSAPPRLGLRRWRLFLMAGAELFGYRGGSEWFVSQYRFLRP